MPLVSLIALIMSPSGLGIQAKTFPGTDLPYQQVVTRMVEKWRQQHGLPGIWCAYIKDGHVVAVVASGYKSTESKAKAEVADYLNIGSFTKIISSAFISSFVDKGVLSYSTRIRDVFPNFSEKYPNCLALDATVQQLLTHRGGVPATSILGSPPKGMTAPEFRVEVVRRMIASPDCKRPGGEPLYSNTAFNVAVAMAEKRTGQNFEGWLNGELGRAWGIRKAGLNNPGVLQKDEPTPYYLSESGTLRLGRLDNVSGQRSTEFDCGGGASMTLEDICGFMSAYMNNAPGLSRSIWQTITAYPSYGGPYTTGSWDGNPKVFLTKGGDTSNGEVTRVRYSVAGRDAFIAFSNCEPDPNNSAVQGGFLASKIDEDIRRLLNSN